MKEESNQKVNEIKNPERHLDDKDTQLQKIKVIEERKKSLKENYNNEIEELKKKLNNIEELKLEISSIFNKNNELDNKYQELIEDTSNQNN